MGPEARVMVRPHYGHITMMFGFFVALFSLLLQGVASPKIIAFGTSELATLSNQYRSNSGLPSLTTSTVLTNSAQAKANHMASNMYFAHDAPDGTSPWDFFAAQGYSYYSAGENLALSNQSASSVVDGWYNSPGHRANMLNSIFTEVGYGIAFVSSFTYNGTQYNNVYLVAAHYAQPTTASAPAPDPTPPAPEPEVVQSNETVSTATQPEPVAEEQPIPTQAEAEPPAEGVAAAPTGFESEPENTSRSGEYSNIDTSPPRISPKVTAFGLGSGGAFAIVGGTVEVRRLLRHQPLLPRLHRH